MDSDPPSLEGGASPRLDERVLVTLHELNGRIAFSGLRRALKAHPESLSRALRRLEREGLIERGDGGYRILAPEADPGLTGSNPLRSIARVEVPGSVSPETVLAKLAGRWFGNLRWVGVIERPPQRLLSWARRDGSGYVLLGVSRGALRVYVPDEVGPGDIGEAEDAAYELLGHAVGAVRPSAPDGGVAFLRPAPLASAPGSSDN
ncbi:MAG: helix-turn-helix transcriptional regulator [Thermoplasmata archaeon]